MRIIALLVMFLMLSVLVIGADNSIEFADVSKPDHSGIVTINGRVMMEQGVAIKEVVVKNPLTGDSVTASVSEDGKFFVRIPAIEGQDLDLSVTRIRELQYPLKNLEPGLKTFELSMNGGYLASKSMMNAYNYPLIVSGKLNFVAHNSLGPFASGIDAGRALVETRR